MTLVAVRGEGSLATRKQFNNWWPCVCVWLGLIGVWSVYWRAVQCVSPGCKSHSQPGKQNTSAYRTLNKHEKKRKMHRNTLYQLFNKLLALIKNMKNDRKKFDRVRDLNRWLQKTDWCIVIYSMTTTAAPSAEYKGQASISRCRRQTYSQTDVAIKPSSASHSPITWDGGLEIYC